ncbi:urokinase plasminogen activator surface receptor-like [Corythoichthys intestinalis]|uniref:urokinase plasminogen activator surface receptor-like n=1 Tax=Corythoichthys intestinalis TaxID=161448 RepID=UPI0025A58131|nr:urokinase plasminogen activator surface receptor-like [Corythoichthys intestinalis]XP_057689731.1 urokinase plasminogen activator surface receptor-like [Corythoichthys intestinalis]
MDVSWKSCSSVHSCTQASVNHGVARTILSSQCCTTDLCNNLAALDHSETSPNGRKCYTCNEPQCTAPATLECKGNENHCITTKVADHGQITTMKGCASAEICMKNEEIERFIGTEISCCEGDYCNSGSRPKVGLLLVTPLLCLLMSP